MKTVESLAFATAVELIRSIRRGHISAQSVVDCHLERIRQLDQRIHAFVYVDRAARVRRNGRLKGITIGVKDTQPVRGMPWTCASPKWRERVAERDAPHVARIRSEGAVILGKTNTPEMAAGGSTVNDLFPATNNPWRAGFTPGGSSGGSAAAVAAALCTTTIGDDFAGSVRVPAASCGVVGFKPSANRLPAGETDALPLNCAGPLTRGVADAKLMFSVMTGERPPRLRATKYRIGVAVRSSVGTHRDCQQACADAARHLRGLGHDVADIEWDPVEVLEGLRVVRPVTLGVLEGQPREYGRRIRQAMRRGRTTRAIEFVDALSHAVLAARRVTQRLDSDLDFLLTPTLSDPPCPIPEVPAFGSVAWPRTAAFTVVANFAGLPAISIPAGIYDGLPLGVQLIGRRASDWSLLRLAEGLEQWEMHRFRPPPIP